MQGRNGDADVENELVDNGDADVENELVDTAGEGEKGLSAETSINICTLSCVKRIAGEKLLHNTRSSVRCSVMI